MNDKWGRRLYVAGGVLLVVIAAVHSLSLFEPLVPANPTEKQLLDLMTGYKFDLMGSMRSMDNLLRGFSISFILGMLAMGGLGLALRRERSGVLKRFALVATLWLAAMNAVSLVYFFVLPTAFLVTGLVLFAGAWVGLGRESEP